MGGEQAGGEKRKTRASTCPSLSDRARRYPERPVYADEWNSFQDTSGPFSNTPLRCDVDANNAEKEYVSKVTDKTKELIRMVYWVNCV